MLGFEHPSHMVTHPSTDEAQCCLSLEIFVNSAKKKKKEDENRIKSPLRIEGTKKCVMKSLVVLFLFVTQFCEENN